MRRRACRDRCSGSTHISRPAPPRPPGSLFELTGGAPKLGFAATAVLAALGAPLSLFLIYAAILKGAAETEEDDREYNTPRRL